MTETKKEYIKKKLIEIHSTVEIDKKFNLQDVNIKAEEIFRRVLNATYSWNLIDANQKIKNFPAIDLIDESEEIVLQVTSSLGTTKINDTIKGFEKFKDDLELKKYADYRLIFCYIVKEKEVRSDKFLKDRSLQNDNFIDIDDILEKIDEDNESGVYAVLRNIYVEDKPNNIEITLNGNTKGIGVVTGGTVNQNIIIYNSQGKKLITKEEIEAQRAKEEKLIFSTTSKSKKVYINRDVDALLSNRITQKKGCVLFLHGQGGIGKSTLLEKFSRSDRPTIFIHINERVDMSMVDIFLDENRTTVRNCPKFEAKLDEIFFEREENNKTPFKAEFELLEAIREDFGEHGVFIVDTFEKSKNSHITSRVKFDGDRVRFTRADSFFRFREYLERLIYLFVPHTTFIIAGRNRIGDVNENRSDERFLDIDDVEEIEMQNFSATDIKQYILEHKLPSPTKEQLSDIEKLTHGNPLLVYLLVTVRKRDKDYKSWDELDYSEMRKIVYNDEDYGLIFYFTKRILSHSDIDDIWKLVIPRVLSREIERLLFEDKRVFEELVDVGLLYRGEKRNLYKLHDDVAMAIESYAKKELGSYRLASWHDNVEVARVHRELMEFYQDYGDLKGVNREFEGCYHRIMLREGFEGEFEVSREEFTQFILGALFLGLNKKMAICKSWNSLENSEIIQYIKDLKNEKDEANMSSELYDRFSKDFASGVLNSLENINYLMKLSKEDIFKKDWSIFYALGFAYYNKEEYAKAVEAYKQAIEINPQKDEFYYNIGIVYNEIEKYDKAIEVYTKVIEINPQREEAYYNIGFAYYNKKEYTEAIEAYKKAIEINPKDAVAYNNMGMVYNEIREYDKAIEAYKKIVEINPQNDEAYNSIGMVYCNMGIVYNYKKEYNKAIEAYKKAVEVNSRDDVSYYNIGIASYSLKKFDEVIEVITKSLNINQNKESLIYNKLLFELQLIQNQPFDQALEKRYIELFQNQKEDFIAYEMLKILQNIVQNQEVDIEGWVQKYRGVGLGGWSFDELHEWIDGLEDEVLKVKLREALEVFEGHG